MEGSLAMSERILGPTGSKRRRRFLWVPMLLVACTALFVIAGAQAVHDEGVFQLDGNAARSLVSTPAMPSATDDADNICGLFHGSNDGTNPAGNDKCNVPANPGTYPTASTTTTRASFVTDGSGPFPSGTSDDQYTGGSKDSLDISGWSYKIAASSNDKSDIQNAFAVFYKAGSDKLVYFGGDRTSNSGDENTAFWFLQSPAMESPCAGISGSGCPFTTDGTAATATNLAHHVAANPGADGCLVNPTDPTKSINFINPGTTCSETDTTPDTYGDILVVSAFTGGGNLPNITAYEWIGSTPYGTAKGADKSACGTSSCTTLKILDVTRGCDPNVSGDPACAITDQNQQYTICPSGTPTPPCVVGQNPMPTASPWIFTEKTSDNTNSGANACTTASNKFCPGVYLEAGLNLTALGLQNECTSTFVMDTRSSQAVDSSLQDLAVGQVGSCTTALTSKAGDVTDTPENTGTAVASPPDIGTGSVSSGTDTAAFQVQGANSWSGAITWFICGPFASEPSATPRCDRTKGVPAGSASVSGTDSNTHFYVSGSAMLTSAGTYCWTAHFEPTAGQNSQIKATDDTGVNECFAVAKVAPALTTCSGSYTGAVCAPATSVSFGSAIHDSARLTGLATEPGSNGALHLGNANYPTINATDLSYAGSITFTLKGPSSSGCGSTTNNSTTAGDTNPQSVDVNAVTGNKVYGPVSYTPGGSNGAGTYHWQATVDNKSPYVSPNNTLPQSEDNASCTDTNEDVTVQQIPTSINTQQSWYPNDTAQISAASGNLGDSGTVDFYLYSGADCTGTVLYSERVTLGTSLGTSTSVSTSNYNNSAGVKPAGGTVSPFSVTTAYADSAGSTKPATGAFRWKVIYTVAGADTGHTGRQSNCLESHSYTYTNDNSGGTVSP
jgi:hypothetical protein